MSGRDAAAHALALLMRAARRAGVPRLARQIPAAETEAYAFSLAYMLAARAWLLRQHAPPWPEIERAWRAALSASGPLQARAELSQRLEAADRTRVIASGAEAFAERERLFAEARTSLDLSTYYFQADATGWRAAHQLVACARRGVRVRVLVDRYMRNRKQRETPELGALLDLLRRGGVELQLWHDPHRPFDSNHRKILLADGICALIGGRNFADHYRLDDWRDLDLLLTGPSVRPLSALYEHAWQPPPAPRQHPRAFAPWFDYVPGCILHDPMQRFALACIEAATTSIDLELAYLVGPTLLTHALVRAAQRGVRVRVLTNSHESNDLPYATYAAYAALRHLLKGGVRVHLRHGIGRTLHAKSLVVDGRWVSFGSHNLDYYSSRFCCETTLQVHSQPLAEQLSACFASGLQDSQPAQLDTEVLPFLHNATGLKFFNWAFRDFQ